ncbi:hypothetical protein C446_17429 [Halobiforma nitratireducens JCM 10879]|uniref:Uncharacterized protein n=1 Tax=Halobiforma nitratireducens JCM 10879 TaxID=1227454 RepID=M0L888_9EURY|nr:hypothetical protein C446_17429 [Halobiforma nitratireducens JCM 10879]
MDRELVQEYATCDSLIFVLGNYTDGRKKRLEEFKEIAHASPIQDFEAVLMDELLTNNSHELQGHSKFKVIADHADAIVVVIEDDVGGVTWEQSIIREHKRFFDKTYLLKRTYPWKLDHEKYSWMQDGSLFTLLEDEGRLYEWETVSNYDNGVRSVLEGL